MFKNLRWPVWMVLGFMIAATFACNFSFSTAKLENIEMARDEDGKAPTTKFTTEDTIYVVMALKNAPDQTVVGVRWYRVNVEGYEPNTPINEDPIEVETSTADLWFSLAPNQLAPGEYKVEIYLNDERQETKNFAVSTPVAVSNIRLARDETGEDTTSSFAIDDSIYIVMELQGSTDDTVVSVRWYQVEGEETDALISEEDLDTGADALSSALPTTELSPGQYKVEVYLNNELQETLEFTIGDAVTN